MTCTHDPAFSCDGICWICQRERNAKRAYIVPPAVTMWGEFEWHQCGADCGLSTKDMIEMTARIFEEQPPIEY
jgi:hypothetical protein